MLVTHTLRLKFARISIGTLTPTVNEPTAKDVIAKNVVFCDDGASVIVFYLESHEM